MAELFLSPQAWIAFLTLTGLELVLGIDNIVFISILVDKIPADRREWTRRVGLFLAMFTRVGLLLALSWIVGMRQPLFHVGEQGFSGRDLVLLSGGLFLLWKSTAEIHAAFEEANAPEESKTVHHSLAGALAQIVIIDLVFSLDSVVTAVGMVDQVQIMIAAVIASVGLMMFFAPPIGRFVSAHATIKMLALAFLVAIAVVLIAESFGHHIPKGYIYSAMAFSLAVEALNISLRKRSLRSKVNATVVTTEDRQER
ncbi:MAG TPA: TerC family protein [Burkholderiaceae bacterium]